MNNNQYNPYLPHPIVPNIKQVFVPKNKMTSTDGLTPDDLITTNPFDYRQSFNSKEYNKALSIFQQSRSHERDMYPKYKNADIQEHQRGVITINHYDNPRILYGTLEEDQLDVLKQIRDELARNRMRKGGVSRDAEMAMRSQLGLMDTMTSLPSLERDAVIPHSQITSLKRDPGLEVQVGQTPEIFYSAPSSPDATPKPKRKNKK